MEHLLTLCWVVKRDTGPHRTASDQLRRTTISPKVVPGTFWHCVKCRHETLAPQLAQASLGCLELIKGQQDVCRVVHSTTLDLKAAETTVIPRLVVIYSLFSFSFASSAFFFLKYIVIQTKKSSQSHAKCIIISGYSKVCKQKSFVIKPAENFVVFPMHLSEYIQLHFPKSVEWDGPLQ